MNLIHNLKSALWYFSWYRTWRRHKFAEKNTIKAKFNRSVLTKAELAEINSFWKPYPKFKRLFHAFYTDSTGKFFVNYIPDSLWYGCIDPFYNPESKANELDDKSLYERLFPSNIARHPERILTKINGFWVGTDNMLLPPRKLSNYYLMNLNSL